jgi:hypothetical protein
VRWPLALVALVLTIGGTPLVARALATGEPETALAVRPTPSVAALGTTAPDTVIVEPATAGAPSARDDSPAPEPTVDPVIVQLADTYVWDEQSARVAVLQANLGLATDGRYAHATHQAHRNALEFVGLPTDGLPAPPLPPGPSAEQWEALRQCESNGNYAITNPSGKYRGAYQFDRPTWNSVADRHAPHLVGVDPAAAAPADQDYLALALYSERGARPWPHCGRHLS